VSAELWIVRAGSVPYERARAAQRRLEAARQAGSVPDLLLLLEHPPVYTRGRRSDPAELPMGEDWYRAQGIEVCDTDRGGRVTYHGPGQLVAYPIVSLTPYGDDVHAYVRRMEEVMIETLGEHGVGAGTIEGLTGVWTAAGAAPAAALCPATAAAVSQGVARGEIRKIGSIGIHVSRAVTTHGLAINVSNDLQPFEWIVPCGIDGCRMTSLSRELGSPQDLGEFAGSLAGRFADVYDREPVEVALSELAGRADGAGLLAENAPAGALR
jgi:lipoyl(octanoyl) transferase